MPKTYENTKWDFLWFYSRYWLSLLALTLLKKLKVCLQISNELHNDVLSYRQDSLSDVRLWDWISEQ